MTPLKSENMTKKNGRTFEMTVNEGAKAQIPIIQLVKDFLDFEEES
jgi:hypothetical protein